LYAQDEGLYGRYGLDVESVAMVTGGAVAALMNNDLQYVYAASTLLLAAARGLPLRTFWQGSRGPTLELFARPEITGFADLRGKAMNSASGGVSHEIIELLLEKHGVDPRDVGVVVSGSAAAQMEHLRQGLVVASITAPPWTVEARRAGFRHLASAGQEIAYPYSLFATTTARLAEDPEHVRAIIRGSLDAQRLMRQDPAGVIAWITRRFEVDEEIASESYALSIAAQNDHGEVLREAVTNYFRVQKEHPELRDTHYEDVVDMRLLREVWLEQGVR
jgi:ABC-type nitrate/sulfonate/bicarbonate transport system substrate-binding protein